jgi:predicted DNA binding protein
MSIVAELQIRSDGMVLVPTQDRLPALEVDVVTEVATDPQRPYLYAWISGVDREAFERAIAQDPTVAEHEDYTHLADRSLYRIQVSEATDVVTYPDWVEFGVTLLEATWADGWWRLQLRVPNREALGEIREWCAEQAVALQVCGVVSDSTPGPDDPLLTAEQREVLRRAYEMGYFEIPRGHTMADLAADLDLSSQAVSERLRRGYRTLVAEHVL